MRILPVVGVRSMLVGGCAGGASLLVCFARNGERDMPRSGGERRTAREALSGWSSRRRGETYFRFGAIRSSWFQLFWMKLDQLFDAGSLGREGQQSTGSEVEGGWKRSVGCGSITIGSLQRR